MRLSKILFPSLFGLCFLFCTDQVSAQIRTSVHYQDQVYHSENPGLPSMDVVYAPNPAFDKDAVQSISHAVYGFHPYWISDATASGYYYSLLTHVAYFSAEVDESSTTTGGFTTTRNWLTTQVVNY